MKDRMDNYRTLIAGFLASVLGWLEPIVGDVFALLAIFVLNFVFGLLADRIANGKDFDFKKAWRCIEEALIFVLIVTCIYLVGKLKDQGEAAVQCVSSVSYVVIYFYTTNILKNIKKFLKTGTPAYKVVDFLYFMLSFEVIQKIPVLKEYLEQDKQANEDNKSE